jgi:hypothetical protein
MKPAFLSCLLALAVLSALPCSAEADDTADILAAVRWLAPVVGRQCDLSPLKAGDASGSGLFDIRYRSPGQDEDEADQRFTLIQLPCRIRDGNATTLYMTRTDPGAYRILSFAEPKLDYDYADERFSRLAAPPRVIGYATTSELANASYDAVTRTISMKLEWRGGGGAWSSGRWTFVDGQFLLSRYSVDPTRDVDGAPKQSTRYQVFPTLEPER